MTWHVLTISAQRHKKILTKLEAIDVETYYPMKTIWRKQRSGPRKRSQSPLIPSYLFVATDLNRRSARSILSISGIHRFISTEGVPSICPDDQVERMRRSEACGNYDETARIIAQLIVGDTVPIYDGPFSGFNGIVRAINERRVSLDVELFGQLNTVEIDIDKLSN